MTDEARNPPENSVVLVTPGHDNGILTGPLAPRSSIEPRPEVGGQSMVMGHPRREGTRPPRAGLREPSDPPAAEPRLLTPAGWDQPPSRDDRRSSGHDQVPLEARTAARAEFRAALDGQDKCSSPADRPQPAAIAEHNPQRGPLAELQDQMAAAHEQLAAELRAELHRALEADRAAWEAALARLEERASLAERHGLDRHRRLIQAMAQRMRPISNLLRDLDRAPAGADEQPASSPQEPGALLPTEAVPEPPGPEPGSIVAVCDTPGPHLVTVGPGHLRVRGWALSKAGVAEVTLLVDGLPREGVVYGATRLDVEASHPDFPDADRSGFVGKVDLEGLAEGEHSLVVRVRGRDGGQLELNRSFRLDPLAGPNRADLNAEYPEPDSILAVCDTPGPHLVTVGPGHLRVRGWALSKAGVAEVTLVVDGLPREGVVYGATRLDVEASHPDFPDADRSGFVGKIDLEGLAEGEHSLVVRVRGRDGGQLELNRSFRLDPLAGPNRADLNAEYPDWLAERMPTESDLARMRIAAMDLPYQPVISLVVPVYNTPEDYLGPMANSVMAQTYGRWELCLANGGSTAPHVRPFLDRLAEQDARVKVVHLAQNLGIAGHSNAALALATGEFIGLLDSDDLLMPHALFEVARALNDAPEIDLIYSDEDFVDDTGRDRWAPFFKPDWSPDLLFSCNYICHFGVYRRSLVEAVGRFRPEYDGSQDWDLVLRITEQTDRIVHIPSILYSSRAIPGSTARDSTAKPYATDAAHRAIDDALRRRGVAGHVEPGCVPGRWRVRYDLRGQPAVTLVIPTGGNMEFLRPCLGSVLERSTYPNLRVLVTDDSDGTEVADHCRALARRDPRLRYRRFRLKPFNYAAVNNSAVSQVDTPYVVLLNDDITVITPDWVEAMLEHAQRPEVGVVGAQLLYPDRSIQHAGVIMGPDKSCGHAFRHLSEDDPGYFALARCIRNCSAVTFACAMMRRSVFDEVGGLDTRNLAVAFNDVDMCLRIRERGYWVVYTPHAVLFHHESATRTMHSNPGEEDYMRRRWAAVIRHDPFYNPNLTRDAEDYSLNFNAPTIAKRLGLIEGGLPTVRNVPQMEVAPTLGPKGQVAPEQAADSPPAISPEAHIESVIRTFQLGRQIQDGEGRQSERFNDLSARLEQQTARPSPERDAPPANRDRAGPLSTASLHAVTAPERVNGYRPKRTSYPQVRRRIREVVDAELPTGSVVVVVSRGDDMLLELGPRQGWHFPQTIAGVYAGYHPADSWQAIAHLEDVRRKGADYLLFPSTAFWWLGFYGDFRKYLELHYPCICSDPSCQIFQLSTTPGDHAWRE